MAKIPVNISLSVKVGAADEMKFPMPEFRADNANSFEILIH